MSDMDRFDRDLRALLDTVRASLDRERAVLDEIEEIIADRAAASKRFLDALGFLIQEPTAPPQSPHGDRRAFDRLAADLSHAIRGRAQ